MPVIPAAMRPDGAIYPAYPENLARVGWKSVLYDTVLRRVVNEGEGGAVLKSLGGSLETGSVSMTLTPVEQLPSPHYNDDTADSIAMMTRDDLVELYTTLYGSPPGPAWNSAKLRKEVLAKL